MEDGKCFAPFQNKIDEMYKLIFEKDRLETFSENWKELKGYKLCTPKNFAAAGFYNFSSKMYLDNVKCFACQKELSEWEKNDDPWEEHVKRGSECPFVLFKKKKVTTIEDFLQLLYEVKKNILNEYFEFQKNLLKDREKDLFKAIENLQKK